MPTTLLDQLPTYLADAHSIEAQALAQLRAAPDIAGHPKLADAFRVHLGETERHEQAIREQLEAHGAKPSPVKDAVMAAGGKGFVLFARAQTDTPGKLAAHAYSYEALEIGSYELLQRFADRARDRPCAATAALILADEVKMRGRIGDHWDEAVDASLEAAEGDDLEGHLVRYLADAHALESQSIELLERAPDMAGDERLARLYRAHLEETRGHRATIRERLDAHDEGPSLLKEAAMRLGGLNWAMFFEMQPDTPGKFAAFAYAFEHLEIGGYEQLLRVARRAGDHATVTAVQGILVDELATATAIADAWDLTADASLSAQGVA